LLNLITLDYLSGCNYSLKNYQYEKISFTNFLFIANCVLALAEEKTPNKSEFSIQSRAASVSGTLSGPETFNRLFNPWGPVDLTCSGSGFSLSGVGTDVHYSVYEIYSPIGENLVATLESSDFDAYLWIYCDPFDPSDPISNAMYGDDDSGTDLNSAFLLEDGVFLEPNASYFLVVTSYSNDATGDYTLNVDGNVVFGSPASTPVPLSTWTLYLGILLMVSFVVVRLRRII